MAPSPPPPPSPMVWVTQGKTQHLALLLEESEEKALIRWDSNREVEWVPVSSVEKNLPPRRVRRRGRVEPVEVKKPKNLMQSKIEVVAGDDIIDDEVEVLLTVHPPSPMRPLSRNDDDASRNCKRRLHFGTSTQAGESSDEILTVHPASPKRPLSRNDDDDEDASRNCKRQLHFGTSTQAGESSDDLVTVHPPSLKRPSSRNDDDDDDASRNYKRQLHFGTSTQAGESSDDWDNGSLDTQEDVVLADLMATRGKAKDSVERIVHSTKSDECNDAGPWVERKSISADEELTDAKADAFDETENLLGSSEKVSASRCATVGNEGLSCVMETSSQVVQEARGLPNHDALGELNTVIAEDDESQRLTSTNVLPSPNTGLPMSAFTHKSSAYVQNLAEICHTMMNDRRWRIGRGMKALFAWEHGDDLMVILSLSRMYQLPKPLPFRRSCACLLGCQVIHAATDVDGHTAIDQTSIVTEEIDGNDCDSRALNTYCRLYYRKGPWFRIDDIYTKYYAPRRTSKGALTNNSNGQDQARHAVTALVDDVVFQKALLSMKEMLSDLNHLRDQGFLRTFTDEEECGRIAGSARIDGNGVLLSADERRAVIEKIGGSKKKASACVASKFKMPSENEILKQMSQQQSIAAWFLPSKEQEHASRLLPVRPHVNHEVLSKLATAVVMTASKVEYLPASILRAKLIEVKKSLSNIIDQRSTKAFSFSKLDTCYRLREAPLRTLRRCCRLYLCATSGPGDMRGDGTNGWKSIRDSLEGRSVCLPIARFIPPPGDSTWNTTAYPGLLSRFGLAHFGFTDAYVHLPVSEGSNNADLRMEQVFSNLLSFQLWELSVEIRANVDYLMELNELILYDERRKAREAKAEEDENRVPRRSEAESYLLDASDRGENVSKIHVDFLNLLQKTSRWNVISQLCMEAGVADGEGSCEGVIQAVEESISSVFLGASLKPTGSGHVGEMHVFRTDCEKVIFVISVILTNVFNFCYQRMPPEEKLIKARRCWLRHMWWEGVLAYVLWDCIPVLEKRGLHCFASRALEVLVFGSFQPECWRQTCLGDGGWGMSLESAPVGDLMISRRARGKAIERLMIDYIHILRSEIKVQSAGKVESEEKHSHVKKAKQPKANPTSQSAARRVNALCTRVLNVASGSAFISFSAIRALARRLKRPLDHLLEAGGGIEARELGMRMRNDSSTRGDKVKTYVDWVPATDHAVAVALGGAQNAAGSRCSYVGFEDAEDGMEDATSLNVEQLALEYYATGRLPVGNEELTGGKWEGWHDEGGRLRTLFRIICASPLLGMNGGCGIKGASDADSEHYTVHLVKYQGAPFDLHVGSWSHVRNGMTTQRVSGFYHRRSERIEAFLAKLEKSNPQELCDCVYNAIKARVLVARASLHSNATLVRDIQQMRTLSMLAAGFGGRHLAAAFRCMVYDYRHFSGGLPDLLLTRALYSDTSGTKEFVDLGDWVGEEFRQEAKVAQASDNRSAMLSDKDDEFLGCSKVGDSGAARSANRWNRQQAQGDAKRATPIPDLPAKLELAHNGRPILVQCLFVEVKSQNDRLDGRQEDWLNVLDRVGHARVCKFLGKTKSAAKGGEQKQDNSKCEE